MEVLTQTLPYKKEFLLPILGKDWSSTQVFFFFFFFFMSDLGEEFAKICYSMGEKSTCMTCICVLTAALQVFHHLGSLSNDRVIQLSQK